MTDFKLCRICLCTESKFYSINKRFRKNVYENIISITPGKAKNLPQYVCYECATMLYKYDRFRDKCLYSYNALTDLMEKQKQITPAAVVNLKKKKDNILNYGKREIVVANDRVGTYCFVHKSTDDALSDAVSDDGDRYSDRPQSDIECFDDDKDRMNKYEENTLEDLLLDIDDGHNVDESKPFVESLSLIPEIVDEEKKIDNIIETEQVEDKKLDDPKPKEVKKTKMLQPRKKKTKKKKYDSDNETDEEDNLSLKQTAELMDRKTQFSKAQGGKPKVLKFLESGFWKNTFLNEEEADAEFQSKALSKRYLKAPYKCTDCYRGFSQKSMLDRHIPLKHGEAIGNIMCRFCKCRFKTGYYLNKHMRIHYNKYECLRCNLVCYIDKSALFHEEYHNGVLRKCPHCDKEFKHMSTFYTHLRTHRSKHMCSKCGESFVSELGLYLHQKVKHINDNDAGVDQSTYCEVCKIKFDTSVAYSRHLLHSAMHTEDKMLEDDTAQGDSLEEENEQDGSQNKDELYTRKSRVEKTLSAVRKKNLYKGQPKVVKKPMTCQHCGKHFESQTACMKHHHAEHPRKPFYLPKDRVICEICGISLAPSSVPAHLNQHTRRKMYTCDTCGRSFTTNNMLRNHIVTHTGERNFACTICGKRFAQSGSLNLHHRTVHLKEPYPKRNRKKKSDDPEEAPFGNGKEEYRVWRNYFDNNTYTNS